MENFVKQFRRFFPNGCLASLLIAATWSASIREASSVTLAWDPSPDSDIGGYILHYGTNSRSYFNAVDVGNVTTNTVSGLTTNEIGRASCRKEGRSRWSPYH